MVIIGNNDSYVMWPNNYHPCITFVSIDGIVEFSGKKLIIGNGGKFVVRDNAKISFGDLCYFTGNNKIVCSKRIIIADMVRMSWDTQVYDTNFHYLYSEDGVVHQRSGEVVVGHHSFIGNRVTLQKGTVLPPYSIVASNSLVNKDYSSFGSAIFGGVPAKFLSSGRKRLFNYAMEYSLDDYFQNNLNVEKVQVDLKEVDKYYNLDNFIFTPVE